MTDRELLASWDLDILCAKYIGSVTLSKEFILAIDDFINRQKAEIERLQTATEEAVGCFRRMESLYHIKCVELKVARAEAVKEFAERLKAQRIKPEFPWDDFTVTEGMIDDLVKEFTEGG